MPELKSSAEVLNRFMGEAETEWVQVEDWSTVRPAQRVRLTLGTNEIVGIAKASDPKVPLRFTVAPDGAGWFLHFDREDKWSLFIEKPKVQLPTEPGFYMTASSAPDVFQLHDGEWYCGDDPIGAERVRHDGGNSLTLLRPVAEVAAEVLDAVQKRSILRNSDGISIRHLVLENIADEFGVTK